MAAAMITRPAIPPTTPPAIAPVDECWLPDEDDDGDEDEDEEDLVAVDLALDIVETALPVLVDVVNVNDTDPVPTVPASARSVEQAGDRLLVVVIVAAPLRLQLPAAFLL